MHRFTEGDGCRLLLTGPENKNPATRAGSSADSGFVFVFLSCLSLLVSAACAVSPSPFLRRRGLEGRAWRVRRQAAHGSRRQRTRNRGH